MRIIRTPLVAYRSSVVTPDTAEALRMLEIQAKKVGDIRLAYKGVSRHETLWDAPKGPLGLPPHLSLRPAGREVYLQIHISGFKGSAIDKRQAEVELLWGLAVPLGFTPWNRYPLAGKNDTLFHFLGPWQSLYDHLCGEGRGGLAWPSVCAAAQVDAGGWYGTKKTERFIQAQLHRLGFHCGPVDGLIGERTTGALRGLGVQTSMEQAARSLANFDAPQTGQGERRRGHVIIPGDDVSVQSYGGVVASRIKQGIALTIDGPGRVIINIGHEV